MTPKPLQERPVESASVRRPRISIRLGVLRDLPVIESVERAAAGLFAPQDLPMALAQPVPAALMAAGISASLLWVAEDPVHGLVGFALCEVPAADCLHIRELDVHPSHVRKGTGSSLLVQVCACAKAQGLRFVTLTTFSHLPWNAAFYGKFGFDPVEDHAPFPHLAAALRHEHEIGLRNRVAMFKRAD